MNFLCWWRGLKGPYATLNDLNPSSLASWKEVEHNAIAIIPLPEVHRSLTLGQAIAAYPCPAVR